MDIIGRGRGLARASSGSINSKPIKLGRGTGFIRPSQFIQNKNADVSTPTKPLKPGEMEVGKPVSSPLPSPNDFLSPTKIENEKELTKAADLLKNGNHTQLITENLNGVVIQEKLSTVDQKKPTEPQEVKPTEERSTVDQAEEEWHVFKCERQINQILRNVNEDSIGEVYSQLELLVQEGPLSSRFTNCSEVRQLIDVLVKKGIQNEGFIQFSPCLLKMVSEHSPIEFDKYFPVIIDKYRKESVTVSTNEGTLPEHGVVFCQLLARIFTLPRQTGARLYKTILACVDDCIERWTYSCKQISTSLDGFAKSRAVIHGLATRYLLVEIALKIMSCDSLIEKRMEHYTWLVRDTILNAKLPKKVREVFLDSYVKVKVCGLKVVQKEEKEELNDEEMNDDDDDVIVEDDDVIVEDDDVIVEEEEEEKKEETSAFQATSLTPNGLQVTSLTPTGSNDAYLCVKYLLTQLDLEELIPLFVREKIDDFALAAPYVKQTIERANIKKVIVFKIYMALQGQQMSALRERALSSFGLNSLKEIEPNEKLNEHNTETNENCDNTSPPPFLTPTKLAMSFPTKTSPLTTSVADDTNKIVELREERSLTDDTNKIVELGEERSLADETDKIVELEENTNINTVPPLDNETYSEETINTQDNMSSTNDEGFKPGEWLGRGRGVAKLPKPTQEPGPKTFRQGRFPQSDTRTPGQHTGSLGQRVNGPNNILSSNNSWRDRKRHPQQRGKPHQRGGRGGGYHRNERSFEPVYHGSYEQETDSSTPDSPPPRLAFGTVIPKVCLNCQSPAHSSDQCNVANPFFN